MRDQNDAVAREDVLRYLREQLADDGAQDFALGLYEGTLAHQGEIDPLIAAAAENWRLERIANLDRNAIRLGAFELIHATGDMATGVVLNETIELARKYGSAESPGFVNGVLDRVYRDWSAKASVDPAPPEAPAS